MTASQQIGCKGFKIMHATKCVLRGKALNMFVRSQEYTTFCEVN